MKIGNMENLPEKTNNAVVIRRSIPVEVVSRLNPIDRDIWVASTKKPISDYSPEELTNHVGKLSAMIAKDAGIKQIDAYSATRFVDILRKYYYTLSLSEIKTAFELCMTGQLDEYLPKDNLYYFALCYCKDDAGSCEPIYYSYQRYFIGIYNWID